MLIMGQIREHQSLLPQICLSRSTTRAMNGDENDQPSSNAPLLSSDHPVDRDSHDPNSGESINVERGYSGGWFIWVLTLSAGISGLLFGYEYVLSLLSTGIAGTNALV